MTAPGREDRRAVRAFLDRRDEASFRAVYDRHTPRLYGLALRLTRGDEERAAEIVQEAWVRAVPKLGEFRWASSLGTWLGAFVVNCARELTGLAVREQPWGDAEAAAARSGRGSRGWRDDEIDVMRALEGLPEGYRTVLILYGVYGYSHGEIADMLGISPGTSKSQLSRGRRALREALT